MNGYFIEGFEKTAFFGKMVQSVGKKLAPTLKRHQAKIRPIAQKVVKPLKRLGKTNLGKRFVSGVKQGI